MAKLKLNLFLILLFITVEMKTGKSEEKQLTSTVSKGLQIFKKYLVPQVEMMERLVKKIQLLDFELQKKLLVLLEEDTDKPCKNEHKDCDHWAKKGECPKYESYMLKTCSKACNMCITSEKEVNKGLESNKCCSTICFTMKQVANILFNLFSCPTSTNAIHEAQAPHRDYEPLTRYGTSNFDWVITELEVFMHRIKEDKGKVRNVYESVKKTLQIFNSKRAKELKNQERDPEWYDYLKDYNNQKSKLVKKLLNTILETEKQLQEAYAVLNSASKILQRTKNATTEEKMAWKVNLALMERHMIDLKNLELKLVHVETFRSNSLITASIGVKNAQAISHRFFWFAIIPVIFNLVASVAFSFIRRQVVRTVVSFVSKKVVSSFFNEGEHKDHDSIADIIGFRSMKTPENPVLGSRIRNFGKKFGNKLRYEFNNLPDFMGSFTPLNEKELYCQNIRD